MLTLIDMFPLIPWVLLLQRLDSALVVKLCWRYRRGFCSSSSILHAKLHSNSVTWSSMQNHSAEVHSLTHSLTHALTYSFTSTLMVLYIHLVSFLPHIIGWGSCLSSTLHPPLRVRTPSRPPSAEWTRACRWVAAAFRVAGTALGEPGVQISWQAQYTEL